jgi:uncharacterized protein (UPF0261 family)
MAAIAVLGTFDTKGAEHAFLAECIRRRRHDVLLIDVGTGGPPRIAADISREEVATAGGIDLAALAARGDRGECVAAMSTAAPRILARLQQAGRIAGAVSLGGGGGTAIASAAMRALPLGFPKLIVSTLAAGNTAPYIGESDLVLMPSIVDIAGLNRISRMVIRRAAGAICGMVESTREIDETGAARPLVVASMFGNTTRCVGSAKELVEQAGYEVLTFHATGAGGRMMEATIAGGFVAGVLDITTTEWADELVGGVLTAGPHRLEAAGRAGVPTVVVPGCLDMVNFGAPDTVPPKFAGRKFYAHNPQVTLMRTSAEECAQLGRILAEKLNAYTGPITVLLPLRGLSVIGAPGGPFHDPQADAALFTALKSALHPQVEVREFDLDINAPPFASSCADALLRHLSRSGFATSR